MNCGIHVYFTIVGLQEVFNQEGQISDSDLSVNNLSVLLNIF